MYCFFKRALFTYNAFYKEHYLDILLIFGSILKSFHGEVIGKIISYC
jgi:hypothetical protein